MKCKYSRKQMLPGLQRFKKSPMKAADANLVKGASKVAQADIDAAVSKKYWT